MTFDIIRKKLLIFLSIRDWNTSRCNESWWCSKRKGRKK